MQPSREFILPPFYCPLPAACSPLTESGERDKPWEASTGTALISADGLSREPR
jgi:hypothetical protein